MERLAIIGSGDLGQLIAHHASNQFKIVGFFDDFKEKDSSINGIKVLGQLSEIMQLYEQSLFDKILIGIGYKHMEFREQLFEKLYLKLPFATYIHPSSFVDTSCKIGKGVFIMPGCTIDRNVYISNNVFINLSSSIAHDSSINSHTFLSPNVAIAGFVKVGKRNNIGVNTTIIDNVSVTNDVQTGGGTVVIQDLNEPGLYVGNPSRFLK